MKFGVSIADLARRVAVDALAARARCGARGVAPRRRSRGSRWAAVWLLCVLPLSACALEINTATRAELERLNGVGVALAERVLNERAKAPFRDWEDLQRRVRGIRGARIERLQAQGVTVNGIRASRATREDEPRR
jgi:competence protein ComEA